jgi:hypothetical protein
MYKINSTRSLRQAILELEKKQVEEGRRMKAHCLNAYESVKPINLIVNTFKDMTESKELKDSVLSTTVGLAAGYLSRNLFDDSSESPLKKMFGTAIMLGLTNVVTRNPEAIKSLGMQLVKIVEHNAEERIHEAIH